MGEYRIDELARLAGATVRNVRVYQDRGLLAPPRRNGRVGIYTDAHLARLQLIGRLLRRGYTFATIGEMLAVWERGGNLADVLDLESAVGHPWSDEVPGHVTGEQLRESFGAEDTPGNRARAVALGLLEPDGEGYRVPSPRLLRAGAEMVAAGLTLPAVLDLAERIQVHVDAAARDMAATVAGHVVSAHLAGGTREGQHVAEAAAVVRRLRPLAQTVLDAMLAQAMARQVQEALGDHVARALGQSLSSARETALTVIPHFAAAGVPFVTFRQSFQWPRARTGTLTPSLFLATKGKEKQLGALIRPRSATPGPSRYWA